jgi:uncharacterized protein (TIGR03435 family)
MLKHLLLTLSAAAAFAQTASFEVASIRPAPPLTPDLIVSGKMHVGMKTDAGRVDIGFMSLRDLMVLAYTVKPFQITGPDWMTTQRFDILAKLPDGASTDQVPQMMQALLAERFGLKIHRDTKETPVYALTTGKGGPKFKESPPEVDKPPEAAPAKPDGALVINAGDQQVRVKRDGASGASISTSGGKTGPMRVTMGQGGNMHMEMDKMTMAGLADMLTPMLDRPVVDRTDLKGNFQIGLDLAMQDMMAMAAKAGAAAGLAVPALPPPPGLGGQTPAASDPSGGSIFASVQQLGLKLEKEKAPFEKLVVDHLEKNPTDN